MTETRKTQQAKKQAKKKVLPIILLSLMAIFGLIWVTGQRQVTKKNDSPQEESRPKVVQSTSSSSSSESKPEEKTEPYVVSEEEKSYLKGRFDPLIALNPDTIAYVYAPGTMLDEPVVQGKDNAHYLDYTIDGQYSPYIGTVYMDYENNRNFTDSLTWLFGHARGSTVPDHRMFNDVNFYEDQTFFDQHRIVVIETPERKYYYEAAFFIIVPETTAFYRTSFESKEDFAKQLTEVSQGAKVKATDIKIRPEDNYIVLSTCREEDVTIRSNLYLRQIPDQELKDFLAKHEQNLTYRPTRE